jgi:hypothetical protein
MMESFPKEQLDMIEPGIASDNRLSSQTPLYVSKRSFKNLWQEYRIYLDRIELQCWIALHTLKIPVHEIADIQIRSPFSFWDLLRVKASLSFRGLKIDQSDLYRHIVIKRKSGLVKYIVFTPDNPDEFADIIKLLMEHAEKISSLMENEE